MSRVNHAVERGLRIYNENSDTAFVDFLSDSGAPLGTAGKTDEAPIGSLYLNQANGDLYTKVTDTSSAGDWVINGASGASIGTFRPELVRAVTNDAIANGNTDPTSWSDNESGIDHTSFVVGDFVVVDADGTPVLREVTALPGAPNITLGTPVSADPLAEGDTFIARYYFPDSPAAQEGQAIILKTATVMAKLGDVNWEFATGINLSAAYTATNGAVTNADTVESAISKLDGNQSDIQSASGLATGAIDYGTFTGDTLADNQDSKELFQRIEDLLEQMRGVQVAVPTGGVLTNIDFVPHASVNHVVWHVEAFETATPANRKSFTIEGLTDGTSVDDTEYARLRIGSNFNLNVVVDVTGANMRLRISTTTAGVTVRCRRIEVVQSVL